MMENEKAGKVTQGKGEGGAKVRHRGCRDTWVQKKIPFAGVKGPKKKTKREWSKLHKTL